MPASGDVDRPGRTGLEHGAATWRGGLYGSDFVGIPLGNVMPFDPEGGLPLTLARGLAVAGLLSLFGTLVFARVVASRALAGADGDTAARVARRLTGLARVSALAGLLGAGLWLVTQTADMAGASTLVAMGDVLGGTRFGHVLAAQAVALAAALVALARPAWRPGALVAATVALSLQAGHGHALSMIEGPSLLLASDLLHLGAAGAWLGGLLPLLLVIGGAPPATGAAAARWFSPLGKWCVGATALTAAYQGWYLVASVPGLVGTAYGWMALVKLALLGALLGFAVVNRYWFAPALRGAAPAAARRRLFRSIAVQTGCGLLVVGAAALLSQLPPALHEQPVWPFAMQPSLVTVDEDPEFRQMVVVALLELGGTLALLAAAVAWRRFVLPAALVAAATAFVAVPNLRLLLVPAYPTSFFRSPTGFAATSIAAGAALYPAQCAACHGAEGRGDGPLAAGLAVPPADLTAGHLWAHVDGEMFWWLSNGIEGPAGDRVMPGFADALSAEQRWALIDFVRANNAGRAWRATGAWPGPIAAPSLTVRCDGQAMDWAALRGRAVRLLFAGGAAATPLDRADLVTITVGPPGPGCRASDDAAAAAYALVLGTTAPALAGTELLIDPNGWLRSQAPGRITPALLAALVDEICTHPLAGGSGGHQHHAD